MKTKNKKRTGTGRYWDGLEIYEATEPLRVFATPEDAQGAKAKDWASCVFAKACARMFGSRKIAFFRRTAYVELPDQNGKPCVERFILSREMRAKIMEFDKTHVAPVGGFKLTVPSPSHGLEATVERQKGRVRDHKAERANTMARRKQREATIVGRRHPDKRDGVLPVMELEWRSGTGMVHFNTPQGVSAAKIKE